MKKRTKIICTIGPASASESKLASLMRAGMNVARLNFSHATHKDHGRLIRSIRSAARRQNLLVPIIGDLQGPKIRLGVLPKEGVELRAGSVVKFTTSTSEFKNGVIPVTYKKLHKDVVKGERMLIDDGILELKVEKIQSTFIHAKVINGGVVTSHKGMNFPDSTLHVSAFTAKDKKDALFAVEKGLDWIALSFVTEPKEIVSLKRLIKRATPAGQVPARVIVKIEKHEAIENFDDILKVTDGVMIARGDLGVEIPAEEVPVRQKEIIEKCRRAGKPVVVATQMMDSMIRNPRPTRAEVSDVANAVMDHTDAVMLSGESATGKFPVKTVKMMTKIIIEAEESKYDDVPLMIDGDLDPVAASSYAVKLFALENRIAAVIAAHGLAPWSEAVLKAHPEIPLFIATKTVGEARQLMIRWSVQAFVMKTQNEKTFTKTAIKRLRKLRWLKKGTQVAVVMGERHGEGIDLIDVE
jgi:pyruvate kinase